MRGIAMYGHDFFIIKEDHDLISESISRLFNTNENERLKNPYFGVSINSMLFEPGDDETVGFLKDRIVEQIELYEPRVDILDLNIENLADENKVKVVIGFKLKEETPDDERFLEFNVLKQE